jgi:DNA repair protein RadC
MQTRLKQVRKFALIMIPAETKIPQVIVRTSSDLNNVLTQIHAIEGNQIQEFFYVVFLNQANKITGYYLASMGGITATVADPRLIIRAAALADCTKIVLCHNHPSGNLKPSPQDESITQKIKMAASYFDIKVLDHIILTEDNGFYSFADDGLI